MAKEYVDQHIVPKRYLDRFAFQANGKNVIGTRYTKNNEIRLFEQSTENVGYIKDYYTVTDKDDPKHWEHFFAEQIDTLCGKQLENIVSRCLLTNNKAIVLDDSKKEVLAKIIMAQLMRVPSSVYFFKENIPQIYSKVATPYLSIFPKEMADHLEDKIQAIVFSEQWQKEQFLNHSFDQRRFLWYCSILQKRMWVVYLNLYEAEMPFITSDNPVLVEGIGKAEIGLFKNGLISPRTCIFFPITPKLAVANYSQDGIIGVAEHDIRDRIIAIKELSFVMDKNLKIIKQAYQHAFIPKQLYDEIKGSLNS